MTSVIFLVVVLAVLTYRQTQIWKNGKALWTFTILYNKNNSRVLHNLAEVYLYEGNFVEARRLFLESIVLEPDTEESYINLGIIEGQEGHLDKARAYFEKAKSVNPKSVAAHNNLGNIYSL